MWRQTQIQIETRGRGMYALGGQIEPAVRGSAIEIGLCHLFLRHTSASLCLTENADPQVQRDLERFAQRMANDGDPLFRHDAEGRDDMPAHVRNLVFGYELTIPVCAGHLSLGDWQGIFLWEHRYSAMQRHVIVTLTGQI